MEFEVIRDIRESLVVKDDGSGERSPPGSPKVSSMIEEDKKEEKKPKRRTFRHTHG